MMRAPGLALALAALLAACTPAARRPSLPDAAAAAVQSARAAALAQRPNWQLVGRIAISDGRDGGSGRLQWEQEGQRFEVTLNAPVTRRSWRLRGDPDWARLEGLDGGPFEGPEAGSLLLERLGWEVPLPELGDWVRGLAGDGGRMQYGESGLPLLLEQGGWRIEYRDWLQVGELAMPRRVFARRAERTVRLTVDTWSFPGSS